jgi:hypothetical protein
MTLADNPLGGGGYFPRYRPLILNGPMEGKMKNDRENTKEKKKGRCIKKNRSHIVKKGRRTNKSITKNGNDNGAVKIIGKTCERGKGCATVCRKVIFLYQDKDRLLLNVIKLLWRIL